MYQRKSMRILLFWVLLFGSVNGYATLMEADRFAEMIPVVDSATIVLIDLDNTLFEAELMLGSAPWRSYFHKKLENLSFSEEERDRLLEVYWDFLQETIPVRLVDPESKDVIAQIREEGILVFGFTARAKRELGHTQRQLQKLGVQFTPFSAPLFENLDAAFEEGVIYCGECSKEEGLIALLRYLQQFDRCCAPETVLLLDDREDHVLALEPIATAFQLKYIGIHFTGADARSAQFDPKIVEYQWKNLPLLIPDAEAGKNDYTDGVSKAEDSND